MLEYIITFFAIISTYRSIKLLFAWRKLKNIKPSKKFLPYFIKKGRVGVLLIHGFTSSPLDFRYLKRYLTKRNITLMAPLLPGHGTIPEDLARIKRKQWFNHIKNSLIELKKHCNKVFIAGSSLGGNLAFLIAQKHKVNGIISLGTPIFFKKRGISLIRFMQAMRLIKDYQKKYYFNNPYSYDVLPLNKLGDILYLGIQTRKVLPDINVPTLVMQSTTDFQLSEENAKYIYDNIASKNKKLFFIKDAYHVFITDKKRNMAFKEIYNFIKKN